MNYRMRVPPVLRQGGIRCIRWRASYRASVAVCIHYFLWIGYCERRDLNPYAVRHQILSLACLPFHHSRTVEHSIKRLLSPCQPSTLLLGQKIYAGNRDRTGTTFDCRGILSPLCLPIPPSRHRCTSVYRTGKKFSRCRI